MSDPTIGMSLSALLLLLAPHWLHCGKVGGVSAQSFIMLVQWETEGVYMDIEFTLPYILCFSVETKNSFKSKKNIFDTPNYSTVHPSPGSEKPINTEADIGCFAGKPRLD